MQNKKEVHDNKTITGSHRPHSSAVANKIENIYRGKSGQK